MTTPSRPNVLLIICDQFRGDCLGVAGHPVVETPHLDQLARGGTRFAQAYAAVPSCIASRVGLLTGMAHKHHGRVGYKDNVPFDYPHYLAGELSASGYHTQCVGKMHVSPARNLCGFHNVILHDGYLHHERKAARNYDLVDDYMPWLRSHRGADADLILHGINANAWVARPWHYDEDLHPTTWAATMTIDCLRRRDPTKPFFQMLSFVRPHPPLDPPQVYFDQYICQTFPPVPMGDWAPRAATQESVDGFIGFMGERQLHRARAAYYAQITHIDHQIGRVIEYLIEHEALDNTWIIFSADHGELLGDHNLFRKTLPYDGSARVPLLVIPPGGWQKPQNHVSNLPVELMDIMPTILEVCGAPIPATVDGKSLLPITRGQTPKKWRSYIHGEHSHGERSSHYITNGLSKFIWFSQTGQEQFFNLQNDPCEIHDKIADATFQLEINQMRQYLICELKGREEGYTNGHCLIKGRPPRQISYLRFGNA